MFRIIEKLIIRNDTYHEKLNTKARKDIISIIKKYPKTKRAWEYVHKHKGIKANWDVADYIMINKLHYSDHGRTHAYIVAANALKLLQILNELNVKPDLVKDHGGDFDDSMTIVMLAALLHDVGNQVNRKDHYIFGVMLAAEVIDEILKYSHHKESDAKKTILRGFMLHTVAAHDLDCDPLTIEASVCSIADALDITKGRARYSFEEKKFDMFSLSSAVIEHVAIKKIKNPARIKFIIDMTDMVGFFQIQTYLKPKIEKSCIRNIFSFEINIHPRKKKLIHKLLYKNGKLELE